MSEMTAARKGLPSWAVATIALVVLGWLAAAWYLWRTQVPGDLKLPNLSAGEFFDADVLEETADYARFVRIVTVLSIVATLITLVVLVYRMPRLARATGLGPIGSGMIVAMVMLVVVWAVDLPFSIALRWWDMRHDLAEGGWLEWLIEPWAVLGGSIAFIMLQVAVVMGFARRYPRFWWIPVPPVFLAITVFFVFVSPYLLAFGVDRPKDPQLRRESEVLAKEVGAEGTPVDVEKVSDVTNQPNAFAAGVGPTERIVLFDTLLDGRFDDAEVETVVAHEFGHIARRHIPKGLGWSVLFAFPIAFLIAEATRRRGGLGDPAVLPYGALVLVVINLALLPLSNEISRRYEAEADWTALKATGDAEAAQGLFEGFAKEGLSQPDPPTWWHVYFGTHPTLLQRIEMAEAWKRGER
jgi:STE24 endopeptidase